MNCNKGNENKANDLPPEKLIIVKQILHVTIIGNVRRICILTVEYKDFNNQTTISKRTS